MELLEVVKLLADGKLHSGEELGEFLGVSRTAVWKQLQKLEGLGVAVQSVKGRGYHIEGGLELLDETTLKQQLRQHTLSLLRKLEVVHSIDSTNSYVLAKGRDANGYLCLAEHQSAGRGRQGRPWVSPFGRNIYMSVGWEFSGGAAVLEGLSLAVGVAVVRALKANGIEQVNLKWPNDVLHKQQKLAGILLEMTGDAAGVCQVVVGVGLNVHMAAEEGKAIDQQWVSLNSLKPNISRNHVVASLINELLPLLASFEQQGFAPLQAEWEALDGFRGAEVDIRSGNQTITGKVLGVNGKGALRLQTATGEQLIYGGEASVRRAV